MNNVGAHLLVCLALIFKTEAHYAMGLWRLQFSADDGHDVLYTNLIYYNKKLLISYNSTEEKFIGYTEEAMKIADVFNKNTYYLEEQKRTLENSLQYISETMKIVDAAAPQEPQVRVFSTKTGSSDHPGILVCSAYSFYPKPLTLTWFRNEEEVTSGVTFTDEMSNGNWLYQKHSYLEYTPTAADHISCMVEHASLRTPKLYPWENFPESRRNKLIVGTGGLLLGLAFIIVGVVYYIKHMRGHVLVPN
ncbi:rano class II histocompatibility antigen, A beta chain-like [Periophthalmus magnuspinnatus]|uniref:rano class II histocompatibility antigen, A beta chain-like n=1 Tax=Periophthalmus magnuspinnatus TaxID=409849 RepID=UPI00243664FC|nr:rano class II histocompatibility antigen, A beta chain-like [Periophthalmus magnuspinnatus]